METLQPGQTGRGQPMAIPRLGYRVGEFCRAVGIGRSTFYNLVSQGKIRTVHIAGRHIIPVDEAARLMREGS